jgi:hypothetical protein
MKDPPGSRTERYGVNVVRVRQSLMILSVGFSPIRIARYKM